MYNFFEFCQVLNEMPMLPRGDNDQYVRQSQTPDSPSVGSDNQQGRRTTQLEDPGRKLSQMVKARQWKQAVEEQPDLANYTAAAKALSADKKASRAGAVPESDVIRSGNRVTATIPAHTKELGTGYEAGMAKRVNDVVLSTPELVGKTLSLADFMRGVKDAYAKQQPLGGTENFLDHGEAVQKAIDHLLQNGKSMGYTVSNGMVTTPKGGIATPEGDSEEGVSSDFASNRGEQHVGKALWKAYKRLEDVVGHYAHANLNLQQMGRRPDVQDAVKALRHIAKLSIHGGWDKLHVIPNFLNSGETDPRSMIEKLAKFDSPAMGAPKPVAGGQQPKTEATWYDLYEAMEEYQNLGSRA